MFPEEDAFHDAISMEPFDVIPRLVYADWLDEQHDPRAELLRVHCELATIPTNAASFPDLVEREKSLLRYCDRQWYETIAIGFQFRIDDVLPRSVGTAFDLPDATLLLSGRLQIGRVWSMQTVNVPLVDGSHHTHTRTLLERLDGFVESWGCEDSAVGGLHLQFARTKIRPEDVQRGGICTAAAPPYSTGFQDDPPQATVSGKRKWWRFRS
ncbi:TIGR02996 domain-containing protein [Thalassoroseus pseudoceratinae]|uniref:TIGR02996 domain-containing protein n=1 Tax=Thalassoroseus pseudoceratinae TaxID=2713176 RepID=UPI001423A517|nr:TIGR02996 domain-containing protein [Thalassoroseus pseudoceratinae]